MIYKSKLFITTAAIGACLGLLCFLLASFPEGFCVRHEINIHSGKIRSRQMILFLPVRTIIKDTCFSASISDYGLAMEHDEWRLDYIDKALFSRVYVYGKWHGSIESCENLMSYLQILQPGEGERKEWLKKALAAIEHGNVQNINAELLEIILEQEK